MFSLSGDLFFGIGLIDIMYAGIEQLVSVKVFADSLFRDFILESRLCLFLSLKLRGDVVLKADLDCLEFESYWFSFISPALSLYCFMKFILCITDKLIVSLD
jgi:hypothetical protein